jgi:hypothetical protein
VRGRRFVRPALILSHKGTEVRALADLEHKPWAAQDGEVWTAAFSVDDGLTGAREIELSVAPDITVELRRKGRKLAQPGDTLTAGAAARTSRFKDEVIVALPDERDEASPAAQPAGKPGAAAAPATPRAPRRRRTDPAVELERLGARLASATQALQQERERRAALAKSLEEERTANRQLRTELGQARSELEVAATARAEATAVETELDDLRGQLREAQRRHEADAQALTRRHEEATQALTHDHAQLTEAHATLQAELRQQAETLEVTREALAAERAETGRLHNRLSKLQESRERGGPPPGPRPPGTGGNPGPRAPSRATGAAESATESAGAAQRSPAAETRAQPRPSRRATSRSADRPGDPDPNETQRFDVLGVENELNTEMSPPSSARRAPRRTAPKAPDPAPQIPAAERLRPVNPSLRHRTWWLGRLVVLIMLCGVVVAVYLVLHTTVLH